MSSKRPARVGGGKKRKKRPAPSLTSESKSESEPTLRRKNARPTQPPLGVQLVVSNSYPVPFDAGGAPAAAMGAPISAAMPSVQEVSSSSVEAMPMNVQSVQATFVAMSQAQEAGPSTMRSVEELALASSALPKGIKLWPSLVLKGEQSFTDG
ncbi:hypothetical protein AMTR_s00074p00053000 [Amborella trichopoda]|uniref:Uncharacterized protein n=1 Tax=Amborella trichopoda TaxID=13333 RepID=W1NMX4_AMBTC|nr:hypothetical protein AMTR_s00074p00053000 [Amborella trichopoda]